MNLTELKLLLKGNNTSKIETSEDFFSFLAEEINFKIFWWQGPELLYERKRTMILRKSEPRIVKDLRLSQNFDHLQDT